MINEMLLSGVATGVASLTITRSKLFKPLRKFVKKRSPWLNELFTCPYCMSHWVAAGFTAWLWPGTLKLAVLEWLVTVAIAAPTAAIVFESIVRIHPPEVAYGTETNPEAEPTRAEYVS